MSETEIRIEETCEACSGERKTIDGYACPGCGGTGRQSRRVPLRNLAQRVATILREEKEGDESR